MRKGNDVWYLSQMILISSSDTTRYTQKYIQLFRMATIIFFGSFSSLVELNTTHINVLVLIESRNWEKERDVWYLNQLHIISSSNTTCYTHEYIQLFRMATIAEVCFPIHKQISLLGTSSSFWRFHVKAVSSRVFRQLGYIYVVLFQHRLHDLHRVVARLCASIGHINIRCKHNDSGWKT
jgi:hypothetical protein